MDFTTEQLHDLGEYARRLAYDGEDISPLLPASQREVLVVAVHPRRSPLTLAEGYALVVAEWHAVGDLSAHSQERLAEILAHATYRAERLGVTHWDEAFDEVVCSKFIHSVTSRSLQQPAPSTMHLRRSALRAGFLTLRRLGHFDGDPTLDIGLPARSQLAARLATDDEMVLLRMNAAASRESRQPTVLALAEATATTSESPRIVIGAFDDPQEPTTVALPGGKGVRPRTNPLSPWGSRVIRAWIKSRLADCATAADPLVYYGAKPDGASPQASVCSALHSVFRRAGLSREPDLAPRSIAFWAGRQAFEAADDRKLEVAAIAMGIRSLDKAAARIDYSWEEEQ